MAIFSGFNRAPIPTMQAVQQVLPAVAASADVNRAIQQSVQEFPPAINTGAFFGEVVRGPLLPPYGTKDRDRVMRLIYRNEYNNLVQAVVTALIKKLVTVPWQLNGPNTLLVYLPDAQGRMRSRRAIDHYQDIIQNAQFGAGYEVFVSMILEDFFTQDFGGIIEKIGLGEPIGPIYGPVTGLAQLDAGRSYITGNPYYPIMYFSLISGSLHRMHTSRICRLVDSPSPDERYFRIGLCALSRTVAVSLRQQYMNKYIEALVDDKPPPGIMLTQGLTQQQRLRAIETYKREQSVDERPLWGKNVWFESLDADKPIKMEHFPFSRGPENFDWPKFTELDVHALAAGFNIDVQEIWELTGRQGMGGSAQSQVLHQKSEAKMQGFLMQNLERIFNREILPSEIQYELRYNDPIQKENEATIDGQLATTVANLIKANVVNSLEARLYLTNQSDRFKDALTTTETDLVALDASDDTAPEDDQVEDVEQSPAQIQATQMAPAGNAPLAPSGQTPPVGASRPGAPSNAPDSQPRKQRNPAYQSVAASGSRKEFASDAQRRAFFGLLASGALGGGNDNPARPYKSSGRGVVSEGEPLESPPDKPSDKAPSPSQAHKEAYSRIAQKIDHPSSAKSQRALAELNKNQNAHEVERALGAEEYSEAKFNGDDKNADKLMSDVHFSPRYHSPDAILFTTNDIGSGRAEGRQTSLPEQQRSYDRYLVAHPSSTNTANKGRVKDMSIETDLVALDASDDTAPEDDQVEDIEQSPAQLQAAQAQSGGNAPIAPSGSTPPVGAARPGVPSSAPATQPRKQRNPAYQSVAVSGNQKEQRRSKEYNPDQPRDSKGRWSGGSDIAEKPKGPYADKWKDRMITNLRKPGSSFFSSSKDNADYFKEKSGYEMNDFVAASGLHEFDPAIGKSGTAASVKPTFSADGKLETVSVEYRSLNGEVDVAREFHFDSQGKPSYVVNDHFYMKEGQTGSGLGTKMFKSQVDQASSMGFKEIKTTGGKSEYMNGYYTWPRLGYDAEVSGPDGRTRLSNLMQTEQGRNWWKANGKQTDMSFDLNRSSLSRQVLDTYYQQKFGNAKKARWFKMVSSLAGADDAPELSDADNLLLDKIWDKIHVSSSKQKDMSITSESFVKSFVDAAFRTLDGQLDRDEFEERLLDTLSLGALKAFKDGLRAGGVNANPDEDERSQIQDFLVGQVDYIDGLGQQFENGTVKPDMIRSRARMWVNKSLRQMFEAGRLSADENGMYTFGGIDGDETCPTCARMKGQTHRLKEWHARGLVPRVDTDSFECKGFRCQHALLRSDEKEMGEW